MSKIPFTVSARTARLIGRENIASSKGAIIELVKNAYDADSKFCIIYFDNFFSALHENLTCEQYKTLISRGVSKKALSTVYQFSKYKYIFNSNAREEDKNCLLQQLKKQNTLYIIDVGEGMTDRIIRDCWMTIGTNNKVEDVFTKSGRVKSGAKGIGRFALDKLGRKCEMITKPDVNAHEQPLIKKHIEECEGYSWKVNWDDFDGQFKPIDQVQAELKQLSKIDLKIQIENEIDDSRISNLIKEYEIDHGTIINSTFRVGLNY